ncbi:MAG TPA: hypothetical protein VIP29_01770 [Nitrososphaeraceae archaeon]
MGFEKLEEWAFEANLARNQNMKSKATQIEEKILKNMTENQLLFPVEEEVLMTKNSASFVYKNGKTYPSLLEFMGRILHVDIPIKLNECKFGPGGIIISAENKEQAQKILHDCSQELQTLIKAKKRQIG